eukprot:123017_1
MSNRTTCSDTEMHRDKCAEAIKILFLDIDGVMNGWEDLTTPRDEMNPKKYLKPKCLERLQRIVNRTNCKIVLSTARRACAEMKNNIKKELIKAGIKWNDVYLGDTPLIRTDKSVEQQRLLEISTYLNRIQKESKFRVETWVAVDDLSLDSADENKNILKGRFVRTDGRIGITDINVLEIIETLKYYNTDCVIL